MKQATLYYLQSFIQSNLQIAGGADQADHNPVLCSSSPQSLNLNPQLSWSQGHCSEVRV